MKAKDLRLKWHDGNQIELLHNGEAFFPALCKAIDAARHTVHLETYIFNLDQTGQKVLDHLRRACERDVKVRVVLDGFGSQDYVQDVCRQLADMGAQFRVYRPEPSGLRAIRFNLRRLRRLHRKVTTVDNAVAFVGGINILDDYVDVPDDGQGPRPRFDFVVSLRGPIVDDASRAQRILWLRMAWRRRDDWAAFYRRVKNIRQWMQSRRKEKQPVFPSGRRASLVLRDNIRLRQSIEDVYLKTVAQAQAEVLIANAYFFPRRRLLEALERAAGRGVRVRLLLQGRVEYAMQYRASRYLYCKLLDDGIELYEYTASYLHAKVAVMDDCATVGSSNLDPFSLLLAREANVCVRDADFAAELARTLEAEIQANAQRVTEASLERRGWLGRWADACSYYLLRFGVALTGRGSEY